MGAFTIQHPIETRWVPLRISTQEHRRAMRLAQRLGLKMRRILGFFILNMVAAMAVGLFLMESATGTGNTVGGFMFLLPSCILAGLALYQVLSLAHGPWLAVLARREYRKQGALGNEVTIALDIEGIRFATPNRTWLTPWQHIQRWREDAGLVLIYTQPKRFSIIPKRLGAQGFDIEGLVACLQRHVGPPD